ncbi:MAG: M56 family metallopeptidase [Bacteroides sp.]|nr:M56 family metallopeptidase [Bacteroides sp.]
MGILESSSSWIIALGKTLLNSLWLGLLFLSVLKAIFLILPQRFAAFRYQAALLTLFLFFALSAGLFFHLFTPGLEATVNLSESLSQRDIFSRFSGGSTIGLIRFYHLIGVIYISGMGIYLSMTIVGVGKIRSLRQHAEPITGKWYQRFIEIKGEIGISRSLEFLKSDGVDSPFLTGLFKPAIIVPAAMLSQLSISEVESILWHELYHLKRLDHLMNLIQRVVEILFFFNPAVWEISKMIRSEREKSCDDLVLARHSKPLDYARALYLLSAQQQRPAYLVTSASGVGRGELKNRIERILKPNKMNTNFRDKLNTLLLFSLGLVIMLIVSGFSSGLSISRYNDLPEEMETSTLPVLITQSQADTLTEKEKQKIQIEVREALAEIDWEAIKEEVEEARHTIMVDIDWEEMKMKMEEVKHSIEVEIDWDEVKMEMDEVKVKIDLMMEDLDLDFDIDTDFDSDIDSDVDIEVDVESEPHSEEK